LQSSLKLAYVIWYNANASSAAITAVGGVSLHTRLASMTSVAIEKRASVGYGLAAMA